MSSKKTVSQENEIRLKVGKAFKAHEAAGERSTCDSCDIKALFKNEACPFPPMICPHKFLKEERDAMAQEMQILKNQVHNLIVSGGGGLRNHGPKTVKIHIPERPVLGKKKEGK